MMIGALKMALGLRQYAPRLKMFEKLKEEAAEEVVRDAGVREEVKKKCCFATVGNGGRYATDVASLRRALNEAAKEDVNNTEQYSYLVPTEFDHIYPNGKENDILEGSEVEEKAKEERCRWCIYTPRLGRGVFWTCTNF